MKLRYEQRYRPEFITQGLKNRVLHFFPPLKEFHPRNSRVQSEINTDHTKT